ncbi:MAG: hypothetical protein WD274_03410 [Acidimicrobiia bacterium]
MRRVLLAFGLLIGTAGPVLASLNQAYFMGADAFWPLAWVAWAPMGYLILVKRPGNGVGAGLMFIGLTMGASFLLGSITATDSFPMSVRVWAELGNMLLGVAPWFGVVWLLLVFPSGSYSGSAQRRLGMFLVVFGILAAAAFAVGPKPMFETGELSPLFVPSLASPASVITDQSGFMIVIVLTLLALMLLVRRWRASAGVQRAQFRWLFFGASVFAVAITVGQFFPEDSGPFYVWIPGGIAIPVTIGVAVLRYRLYDIDRIISRTVSYALVLVVLGLVVLGLVALFAVFLPSDDPLVVAISTLAAAVLFDPVRRRVQALIDRRFNRSRYNAQRVIGRFTESLQEQVDPAEVVDGWVEVVEGTMQPEAVGVWVKR